MRRASTGWTREGKEYMGEFIPISPFSVFHLHIAASTGGRVVVTPLHVGARCLEFRTFPWSCAPAASSSAASHRFLSSTPRHSASARPVRFRKLLHTHDHGYLAPTCSSFSQLVGPCRGETGAVALFRQDAYRADSLNMFLLRR